MWFERIYIGGKDTETKMVHWGEGILGYGCVYTVHALGGCGLAPEEMSLGHYRHCYAIASPGEGSQAFDLKRTSTGFFRIKKIDNIYHETSLFASGDPSMNFA